MWMGTNGRLKTDVDTTTFTPGDTFALFIGVDGFKVVPGESGQLILVHVRRPQKPNGDYKLLIHLGFECSFDSVNQKAVYMRKMFSDIPAFAKSNGASQTPIALLYSMYYRLYQDGVLHANKLGDMEIWQNTVRALNDKILDACREVGRPSKWDLWI
ncbi:hypothetical protein F5878DRAFT_608727 [Lentinula raphanica]|uniref:Uncharacterized protein n=1 Tax=Lentinula raphanica TaxID=153919 RepID=A0AA38PGA8_9AGAR|nr:hypothetical protein F5878DRAFT_608727 [Lentinula raphanica]